MGDIVLNGVSDASSSVGLALTHSGAGATGILTLQGAMSVNGNVVNTSSFTRLSGATPLGTLGGATGTIALTGNGPANGVLDLRYDGAVDLTNHSLAANLYGTVINADRALSGSGSNNTVTFYVAATGAVTQFQSVGYGLAFEGANSYSMKFTGGTAIGIADNMNGNFTLFNYVAQPGNVEFASGLNFITSTAQADTIPLAGPGDFKISGAFTYPSAGNKVDTIAKSGYGLLTVTATNSSSFNYANATWSLQNGITRITAGNQLGGANTTVNLAGGRLDILGDTPITLLSPITVTASNSYINVDKSSSGTGGSQTLGGLKIGANFSLFVTGGAGYGLNTGTLTETASGGTVWNNSQGQLAIPSLTSAAAYAFSLGGSNEIDLTGAVTLSAGSSITKVGSGLLKIASGASTYTGATILQGGTIQLMGAAASLAATSPLTIKDSGTFNYDNASATGGTAQSMGALTATTGEGVVTVTRNVGQTVSLTFGSLAARAEGGAVNFVTNDVATGGVNGTDYKIVLTGTSAGSLTIMSALLLQRQRICRHQHGPVRSGPRSTAPTPTRRRRTPSPPAKMSISSPALRRASRRQPAYPEPQGSGVSFPINGAGTLTFTGNPRRHPQVGRRGGRQHQRPAPTRLTITARNSSSAPTRPATSLTSTCRSTATRV